MPFFSIPGNPATSDNMILETQPTMLTMTRPDSSFRRYPAYLARRQGASPSHGLEGHHALAVTDAASPESTTDVAQLDQRTDSNNVSSKPAGEIAGVTLAILIIGMLIGMGISYCFVRFRLKKRSKYMQLKSDILPSPTEKRKHVTIASPPEQTPVSSPTKPAFALDATPDRDIELNFRNLCDVLQRHVRNNYHAQEVETKKEALLVALENMEYGYNEGPDGVKPEAIVEMALDPIKRPLAIQHVIARFLFSSIDVESRSKFTLLPEPLTVFMRSLPRRDARNGSDTGKQHTSHVTQHN